MAVILESYKQYNDLIATKKIVDSLRAQNININAESTLSVIASEPEKYGFESGITLQEIKSRLNLLNMVGEGKDYTCSSEKIQASYKMFVTRTNRQKDNLKNNAYQRYIEEKQANKQLKKAIRADRAKNFFGFLGRLGITGALIAVPTVLAATFIGGPLAVAIGVISGIVGLVQHGVVRGLASRRIQNRNSRIKQNKYKLRNENSFGSNKSLAKQREVARQYAAEYGKILEDENKYAKVVGDAINEMATSTEPEEIVPVKGDERENAHNEAQINILTKYVLDGNDVSKLSEEEKLLVPAATWEAYVLDGKDPSLIPEERANEISQETWNQVILNSLDRENPYDLPEHAYKGAPKEVWKQYLIKGGNEHIEVLPEDVRHDADFWKEFTAENPDYEIDAEQIAELGLAIKPVKIGKETPVSSEVISEDPANVVGKASEDEPQVYTVDLGATTDSTEYNIVAAEGAPGTVVTVASEESGNANDESVDSNSEITVDKDGQVHLFDDAEYEEDVPKTPRASTRKEKHHVQEFPLFDKDGNPINYEEESVVEGDQSQAYTVDLDSSNMSPEYDVVATTSGGTKVDPELLKATIAEMQASGELAVAPAPVITNYAQDSNQSEQAEELDEEAQRKLGSKEE